MACGGCGARRGCSAPEVGGPRALQRARPPARLPLAARDVLARAGVDADHFTLVDEERHPHHRAGLELGGLLAAGGGVAAQPRVGLDDLELDVRQRRDYERLVVPERHDADHALLEPLRVLAQRRLARGVLLEVLRHHEMPERSEEHTSELQSPDTISYAVSRLKK